MWCCKVEDYSSVWLDKVMYHDVKIAGKSPTDQQQTTNWPTQWLKDSKNLVFPGTREKTLALYFSPSTNPFSQNLIMSEDPFKPVLFFQANLLDQAFILSKIWSREACVWMGIIGNMFNKIVTLTTQVILSTFARKEFIFFVTCGEYKRKKRGLEVKVIWWLTYANKKETFEKSGQTEKR